MEGPPPSCPKLWIKDDYRYRNAPQHAHMPTTRLSLLSPLPESTDDSDPDKMHMNNSGSSATYSDYSPSQGSSGSSNPPGGTVATMQVAGKDGALQTHWTNRCRLVCVCV